MKKPEEVTSEIKEKAIIYNKPKNEYEDMESQMVQNSRSKIVFTFNKFFIKVKRDFNQAHQNQVTFNGFSFKVTAYFNQAQQQKLTHSTNFNSTPREYCVKLKKWAFLSFNEKFFSVFENHSTSTPYSRHIWELGPSRSSSNGHHSQRSQFSHQTTKGMLSTTNSNTVNKVLSHNAIEPCSQIVK